MSDSLADAMRAAADTIEKFNHRNRDIYTPEATWSPSELRREAEHMEAEEREEAEGRAQVELLAETIFSGSYAHLEWPSGATDPDVYRGFAKVAFDAGWRKA
jgi:hypothetical protein